MRLATGLGIIAATTIAGAAHAQWVDFVEATDTNLVLDPLYVVNDNIEKDFE